MRIRWHGHACFEIDGSVKVVTDPHDGKSLGIPAPNVRADVTLVSHDHFDHNCARIVNGGDTCVISRPVMTVEKGVRVEGIEAAHDDQGGARRGKVILFRFELDGTSFCHLGDLGHELSDEQCDRVGSVDFLFVPVGNVFTIGPESARRVVERLRPKVAIPMHYRMPGLSLAIRPVDNFLALCPQDKIVRVGNEVEFADEDLQEGGTETWVFSQ